MNITVFFQKECQTFNSDYVSFVTPEGRVGIKNGHEPSVLRLLPGDVVCFQDEKVVFEQSVAQGLVYVQDCDIILSLYAS